MKSFEVEKELTMDICRVDTDITNDANAVNMNLGLGLCLSGVVVEEGIIVVDTRGSFRVESEWRSVHRFLHKYSNTVELPEKIAKLVVRIKDEHADVADVVGISMAVIGLILPPQSCLSCDPRTNRSCRNHPRGNGRKSKKLYN